jgi:hypothetical protein
VLSHVINLFVVFFILYFINPQYYDSVNDMAIRRSVILTLFKVHFPFLTTGKDVNSSHCQRLKDFGIPAPLNNH